jgi:pyruvate formate lyase activating enzyme
VADGLIDYVAIDVKNSPERYAETIGVPGFDISKVDESIKFLLEGNVEYEFRTTVVKQFHNAESFEKIAEWIKGADKYFLQGFVDRETVPYSGLESYSEEEMKSFMEIVKPHVKSIDIRGF